MKEYYMAHKIEINRHRNFRLKNDINFKISCYLRNQLYRVLKYNTKSLHTFELLGCSIEYLKQYLEKQFKTGMSWSNYGKWHVDHIKRCADFDLSKKVEQLKCFNYHNLQPLWALENLIKHSYLKNRKRI